MKLDELKTDHMKTTNLFETKLSAITSNFFYLSSEKPSADLIKWPLLNPSDKASHTSQLTKNIPPWTLKAPLYLNFKNGGIPLYPHYENPYQQKRYYRHTNPSNQKLMVYQHFSLTRHSSKVRHNKKKLSGIIKSSPISPHQRCYYSFINITKIKCQTYQLHEYWQQFLNCCCRIFPAPDKNLIFVFMC